jgi:hypothetical protein
MKLNPFTGFMDFVGKMGLTLKADPPRTIPVEGREWGEEVEGIRLSLQETPLEDSDQLPAVSVVMKNAGMESRSLTIPGWMFFYTVETTAPLSAFGRQLLKPENRREQLRIVMQPGDATATDVPVGSMYDMQPKGSYPVQVTCQLPDGARVRSNSIVIRC